MKLSRRLLVPSLAIPIALALTVQACGPTNSFTYSTITLQPFAISEAQGEVVGGQLYQFGGFAPCCTPTARAYRYDPAANTWTAIAPMPAHSGLPHGGVTHAGMATDGTDIFYAGGYTTNSAGTGQIFGTKTAWRYNVALNTYTQLPDLPFARSAGQLEYLNGQLNYFGGTNLARTTDVGEHYVLDLASGATTWGTAAALPNPRHHMGSAVINGLIYAIGGQHGHDGAAMVQNDVHSYDPAIDTWTERTDLPTGRGHISNGTFVLSGRIVVAGGETAPGVSSKAVEAYTPDSGWAALTVLPLTRSSGVAGALGDAWLFTGGSNGRNGWKATPA